MEGLETLLRLLTAGRGLQISIVDLGGLLEGSLQRLPREFTIHSKPFCDLAKTQSRGEELCFACKLRANQRAIQQQEPFAGYCPWGLYEAVLPVVQNHTTLAVIYVGNYVAEPTLSAQKARRAAKLTQTESEPLLEQLSHAQPLTDPEEPMKIARLVRDYLLALPRDPEVHSLRHWIAKSLQNDADTYYRSRITLRQLAKTYDHNEKYLGRLFKKEMGCSFHQYLLEKRLSAACRLLESGDAKIIDIALESGFENVSYFNRCFVKKYGYPPRQYRELHRKFASTS